MVVRGFHPVTAIGPYASAAVVGKLLNFDAPLMLNAISIAGSHCSGLVEFNQTGGSVKRIHSGIAAVGGIRAALLARAGLTGPPTVLEGKKGFWHAFCDDPHPEKLVSNLGTDFALMGTSFKMYACCHDIQAAIDGTSKIVKEHNIRPDDIEEIIMGANRNSVVNVGAIRKPQEVTAAQFSAAFSLAMCVVKDGNGFYDYTEENLKDPDIKKLAERVRLELDKEVDAAYPATRAARVTIKLKNGTSHQEKLDGPKGSPENPVARNEVVSKFRNLTGMILSGDRVEKIIKSVEELDDLGNISTLCKMLVS
jgi:2-methylcitrate dehydratase PrpD